MDNGLVRFYGCCLAPELGQLRALGGEIRDNDRLHIDPTVEAIGDQEGWTYLTKPGWFFGLSVPSGLWQGLVRTSGGTVVDVCRELCQATGEQYPSVLKAIRLLGAWQVLHVTACRSLDSASAENR